MESNLSSSRALSKHLGRDVCGRKCTDAFQVLHVLCLYKGIQSTRLQSSIISSVLNSFNAPIKFVLGL